MTLKTDEWPDVADNSLRGSHDGKPIDGLAAARIGEKTHILPQNGQVSEGNGALTGETLPDLIATRDRFLAECFEIESGRRFVVDDRDAQDRLRLLRQRIDEIHEEIARRDQDDEAQAPAEGEPVPRKTALPAEARPGHVQHTEGLRVAALSRIPGPSVQDASDKRAAPAMRGPETRTADSRSGLRADLMGQRGASTRLGRTVETPRAIERLSQKSPAETALPPAGSNQTTPDVWADFLRRTDDRIATLEAMAASARAQGALDDAVRCVLAAQDLDRQLFEALRKGGSDKA